MKGVLSQFTDNYDDFVLLNANRNISETRVKKLMESIETYGWIHNAIVCNEKMEIIDGQARFIACQRLKRPVEYVIQEGLTIQHCRAMNIFQKNWGLQDYVDSNAKEGRDSYIWLKKQIANYEKTLSKSFICNICVKGIDKALDGGRLSNNVDFRTGGFERSQEDRKIIEERLSWLSTFGDIPGIIKCRKAPLFDALNFAANYLKGDKNRLYDVIHANKYDLIPAGNIENMLIQFDKLYNLGLRQNKRIDMAGAYHYGGRMPI